MKLRSAFYRSKVRLAAFGRLELLAVLAVVGLLGLLAVPLLADTRQVGDRATCVNNLRLVGRAFQGWAKDHGNRMPGWTEESGGGIRGNPLVGTAWFHFASISNELVSPRILACPSDAGVRPAADFSPNPRGFLNVKYRAGALSYFMATHVGEFTDVFPGTELTPSHFLSGDGNLRPDRTSVGCSMSPVITTAYEIDKASGQTQAAWTDRLHDRNGNILLHDGQVLQLTTPGLREALQQDSSSADNSSFHYLPNF